MFSAIVPSNKKDVLLDDAQQPAVAFHVDVAQVDAVELDRPARRIVEPGHEIAERRFAGAAGTDQRDHLAGLSLEIDVTQHQLAACPDNES